MYSRNSQQGRDTYSEVTDEEYELFGYNLPPKYDGSRFRNRKNIRPTVPLDESDYNITNDELENTIEVHETDIIDDECAGCKTEVSIEDGVCNKDSDEQKNEKICNKEQKGSGIEGIIHHLGERFGNEEILIIALILLIASDFNSSESGDVILLLALLLIG